MTDGLNGGVPAVDVQEITRVFDARKRRRSRGDDVLALDRISLKISDG